VFAYVAGCLRDRATAEDVTAAAFERAYRKRRSFDGRRGEPRAWAVRDRAQRCPGRAASGGGWRRWPSSPPTSRRRQMATDSVEGALRRSVLQAGISA
jgi:RNA polymerase sigma-70 factor (ECF subfamily)